MKIQRNRKEGLVFTVGILAVVVFLLIMLMAVRIEIQERGTITFLNSDGEEWDDSRDGYFNIAFVPVDDESPYPELTHTLFYDCQTDNGRDVNLIYGSYYEVYIYEGYSKYSYTSLENPLFNFKYLSGNSINIIIISLEEIILTQAEAE